jgi:hypothetical protein
VARRKRIPKKQRTRDHVIADLAVNRVEREVLLCGYSLQELQRDYGIDLLMFTYDDNREAEPGFVMFQVKAFEKVKPHATTSTIPVRVSRTDLITWLSETLPIVLAIYNVEADQLRWLYVQAHCAAIPNFNLFALGSDGDPAHTGE